MQNKEELSKMIGPNAELKAMIIAAIPRNTDDPRFEEKLLVVNEVMLEICLLMQEQYRKDIAKLTSERDAWKESSHMYADLYVKESELHNKTRSELSQTVKALRGMGAKVEFK